MTPDPIARIRRFNRAVTAEVGALDTSYLGRGRPLGVARVLCAIRPEGTDVAQIRHTLGLDSGLLSRILRTLEAQGLITVTSGPADRRRRRALPTPEGRAEIAAYDRLSDARAQAILAGLPRDGDRLLAAMDRIALVLNRSRIAISEAHPAGPDARACLAAYYAELAARFDAGFGPPPGPDPDATLMRAPHGAFLLADADGLTAGCVALKRETNRLAEVKRLWIAPAARGLGLATRLMAAAEARARAMGIAALRLDTNRNLPEAVALYRAQGWTEIPCYNDNPYANHWFEKHLA